MSSGRVHEIRLSPQQRAELGRAQIALRQRIRLAATGFTSSTKLNDLLCRVPPAELTRRSTVPRRRSIIARSNGGDGHE